MLMHRQYMKPDAHTCTHSYKHTCTNSLTHFRIHMQTHTQYERPLPAALPDVPSHLFPADLQVRQRNELQRYSLD